MKISTFFSFIILSIVALTSCKKNLDNTQNPPSPPGPFLYVGGSTVTNGIFWKISLSDANATLSRVKVPSTKNITSFLTSGNDVYMAGQIDGYWKNGSFIPVQDASIISNLNLVGNTLFAAGLNKGGIPAYWPGNTTAHVLADPRNKSLFPYIGNSQVNVSGIAVNGARVCVAGNFFFENVPGSPSTAIEGNFGILWDQDTLNLIGKGVNLGANYNSTVGVTISGSDVYVAGRLPDNSHSGGFWKNGDWNPIYNGLFTPASITMFGGMVVIPGTFGTPTSYSGASYYQVAGVASGLVGLEGRLAFSILLDGNDYYALGVDHNNQVVVWKNWNVFETLGAASEIQATCMAIGN